MARMKDFKDKLNTFKDKFKADKSDDQSLKLPYDTHIALNNVIVTKDLCSEMRRIGSHGIVTYSISDDDKIMKKKSLNTLSMLFSETSTKFQDSDPMRGPLNYSALVLAKISGITMEFEKNLQHQVIEPLTAIETRCCEIQELRKKIHDLYRDLGSLHDKYERFTDPSNSDEPKISLLKGQIEELEIEMDNISDLYMQKVLQFEASNFEHAQAIHDMILLRAEYHEKCSKELLKVIPETNQFMEERRIPFSFGYPLENHLREVKKCIAYPIEKCVIALSNIDHIRQEGLFRVSGGKSKLTLLCSALNIMKFDQITCDWNPHVLAGALKRYLREMPVPLLGKVKAADWDNCYNKLKSGKKQDAYWEIKELLNKMPKSYYNNLEYLVRFLNKVVQEKSYNLMSVQNICTVFSPNLFDQPKDVSMTVGMNFEISASSNYILEALLNETNFFFPHSNQKLSTSILDKQLALQNLSKDQNNVILFRTNSDISSHRNKEKKGFEIKSQRRKQQCLNYNIFCDSDNISAPTTPINCLSTSIEEFISMTSPVPPPRKNKN